MIKRLLLAVSVAALAAGGALAQTAGPSPAQPPASMPGYGAGAAGGSSAAGQMPKNGATKSRSMHRATARTSSRVREAQQALQQDGLYKGKVDGQFGPKTRSALAQFQKQNGLKQTARLDRATMSKLMQSGGPSGAAPSGGGASYGGGAAGGASQTGGMPSGGTNSR